MLEIEKDQNLLKEFGRTMAYLAFVEYSLGEVILKLDKSLSFNKIQYKLTLGCKINEIKRIKNNSLRKLSSLIMGLENLNKKRNILAHGITGGRNGLYVIHHRGDNTELTIDFLQGISKDAKKLMQILSDMVWTKVHKNR